jgi:Holliday junction resolvase RusA-like endonuclease
MNIEIIIPGDPIPKHRPRFTRHGRTYSDQSEIMKNVSMIISSQHNANKPYKNPVKLSAVFFMPIPKSISKKKKSMINGTPHIKKPDIDNLLKFYCDCMVKSGNIIIDDSVIAEIYATKIYSLCPRSVFTVKDIVREEK